MKILSYDPRKHKRVLCGEFIVDTFFRTVQPYHFMKIVGGYGIQEDAFQDIVGRGCKKIVIKEVKTGNQWEATVEDWLNHCHIADYGSGKQRFLGLKYMHTHKKII
jgi:hypothetical protein